MKKILKTLALALLLGTVSVPAYALCHESIATGNMEQKGVCFALVTKTFNKVVIGTALHMGRIEDDFNTARAVQRYSNIIRDDLPHMVGKTLANAEIIAAYSAEYEAYIALSRLEPTAENEAAWTIAAKNLGQSTLLVMMLIAYDNNFTYAGFNQ